MTHMRGGQLRVGDCEHAEGHLHSGELAGNRFVVVLRDLAVPPQHVPRALEALRNTGFINYFGMQRCARGQDAARRSSRSRRVCGASEAPYATPPSTRRVPCRLHVSKLVGYGAAPQHTSSASRPS
jgi:hypothetical protein